MASPRDILNVLLEITRLLTLEQSLDIALQAVTDAALKLADGQHSSIRLFDETGTALLSSARSGAGTGHTPVEFRPGEGLVGWVAQQGQRLRLDDVLEDDRYETKPSQGFGIRSYLGIPLWSSEEVIGVLALTSPQESAFSEEDELLAQLLANCIIPAIDRARLRQLSITDDQTKAFNTRYLMPRMRREIERSRKQSSPLSLLSLDIDLFKRVNDTWGHPAGDRVLATFVARVRENVRGRDVLVRRGGDEFVLMMPGTSADVAERVAERIREAVATEPFDLDDASILKNVVKDLSNDVTKDLTKDDAKSVTITVTIGVVEWDGAETAEALEERADQAMYEGKGGGRNRVVCNA